MSNLSGACYRRRRVLMAVLLGAAVLLALCLLVLRAIQTLAPLVGALA